MRAHYIMRPHCIWAACICGRTYEGRPLCERPHCMQSLLIGGPDAPLYMGRTNMRPRLCIRPLRMCGRDVICGALCMRFHCVAEPALHALGGINE